LPGCIFLKGCYKVIAFQRRAKDLTIQSFKGVHKMTINIYDRFDEAYSKELRSVSADQKLSLVQMQAMTIAAAAEALADTSDGLINIEDLYTIVTGLYEEHYEFERLMKLHYKNKANRQW